MELLTVGKISGTHHLKGAVKVVSNIENIEILLNNRIVVEVGENNQRILTVKSASHLVGNKCVLEFEEITNKTEAGNLKNGFIKVRREILGVGEDEYLLNDLLNMKAIDIDTEEELGTVVDIFETAAHDIVVIESAKYEVMVPDIDEFVKKIDFDKRVIYIHLIEGMKEEKGKKYQQDDGMDEE